MFKKNGCVQNDFWATLDTGLIRIGSSLEAEALVNILSLYVLFISGKKSKAPKSQPVNKKCQRVTQYCGKLMYSH